MLLLRLLPFLLGLAYTAYLPYAPLVAQNVYVDENALHPTGARPDVELATQRLPAHERALARAWSVMQTERGVGVGVDEYQAYFLHAMEGMGDVVATKHSETVAYGVLRGRRADGKQSVVLVCDYDPQTHPDSASVDADVGISGVGLLLALASQLSEGANWLDKDVVFVAVSHACAGGAGGTNSTSAQCGDENLRDFVRWYHHGASSSGHTHTHTRARGNVRAGSMLAVLGVHVPLFSEFESISLLAGSAAGILPNLDIVSVVAWVTRYARLQVLPSETGDSSDPLSAFHTRAPFARVLKDHKALLRVMRDNIVGPAVQLHVPFVEHSIDAVSIAANAASRPRTSSKAKRKRSRDVTAEKLLKSGLMFVRSINNLIEKLHHSTSLYLLCDDALVHFVTMGKYVYSLALIGVAMPVYGLLLLHTHPAALVRTLAESHGTPQRWGNSAAVVVTAFAAWTGVYLALSAPTHALQGPRGLALASLYALSCAYALRALLSRHATTDYRTIRALTLLSMAIALSPCVIVNFSLTLVLGIVLAPVLLCTGEPRTRTHTGAAQSWTERCSARVGVMFECVVLVMMCPLLWVAVGAWVVGPHAAESALQLAYAHLRTPQNFVWAACMCLYLPAYTLAVVCATPMRRAPAPESVSASVGKKKND